MKNRGLSKAKFPILILLALSLATVLAACANVNGGEDIIDNMSVDLSIESQDDVVSEEEISTPEGYTKTPKITRIVNVSPSVVAVSGECEEGSTIKIIGGEKDVVTLARGNYFIAEVELKYASNNMLQITAKVDGKEESQQGTAIAKYNATADSRLDGNSVSVGVDSRLYFDKMLDNTNGKNLYTVTQLDQIRSYITDNISGYNARANGAPVDIIYVLVPNVTTIYPEIFPQDKVEKPATTIYDQILETVSQTRADVIDMREIFRNIKDSDEVKNHGGLYRVTDSNLTDYASYLTYQELMNLIAKRFPDAAPRAFDEFELKTVTSKGGNLVSYRDLEKGLITEELKLMVPKFSLDLGGNDSDSTKISSIKKYIDESDSDYGFFTKIDATDKFASAAERLYINTMRADSLNLPNALIYRDNSTLPLADVLVERFEKTMLAASNDFDINLSNAIQYAGKGKNVVDYIVLFVSEENMDHAFDAAFDK